MQIQSVTERLTTTRAGAITIGIAAAALAAVLLAVYLTQYRSSVNDGSAPQPVLVAKRLIPAGTPGAVIGAKQLYDATTVPKDSLKVAAISDPGVLNGSTTAVDIYPGQQITANDLTQGGAVAGQTAVLTGDQRAVAISIDALAGSLQTLQTGDHVDVYQQVSRGSTVVKLFRADVPVLQAPGAAATGGDGVVILQVPTKDVADVIYASKHTELQFALRPRSGARPTVPREASQKTMLLYSHTH